MRPSSRPGWPSRRSRAPGRASRATCSPSTRRRRSCGTSSPSSTAPAPSPTPTGCERTPDRDPDLPAALAPAAIEIDGHGLEPLLLALFGERAAPLPEFLAWLGEPAPEGAEAGATRYLYELYRARPDLRAAFPAVGPELVAWARASGVREHPQLGELLYASPERAGAGSLG